MSGRGRRNAITLNVVQRRQPRRQYRRRGWYRRRRFRGYRRRSTTIGRWSRNFQNEYQRVHGVRPQSVGWVPMATGTAQSRALFGQSYRSANAQQRQSRRDYPFYGRGKYRFGDRFRKAANFINPYIQPISRGLQASGLDDRLGDLGKSLINDGATGQMGAEGR